MARLSTDKTPRGGDSSATMWKLAGAIALFAVALVFIMSQYRRGQPNLAPSGSAENAIRQQFQPPSREEMEQRRNEMFEQLHLTAAQRGQIDALDAKMERGSSPEARREAMDRILTAEQREQMRQMRPPGPPPNGQGPPPPGDGTDPPPPPPGGGPSPGGPGMPSPQAPNAQS